MFGWRLKSERNRVFIEVALSCPGQSAWGAPAANSAAGISSNWDLLLLFFSYQGDMGFFL